MKNDYSARLNSARLIKNILCIILLPLAIITKAANASDVIHDDIATNNGISYVLSSDNKIYVVDLINGKVITSSKPIKGLGKATDIDIDIQRNRLYIGSERGLGQNTYTPLTVVNLTDNKFNIINHFAVEPYFDLNKDPQQLTALQNSVYQVSTSPDGRHLYIVDAASPEKPLTTILNSLTGEIIGRTAIGVSKDYVFSADGNQVISIFPSGKRTLNKNGRDKTVQWQGTIAVGDLAQGKWISKKQLDNNKGLQPPHQKISEPFIYLRNPQKQVEVYDRDSGKILSTFNLTKLTNLYPMQPYPLVLKTKKKETRHIALSMMDSEQQGYIVVIDVKTSTVLFKIKVGKFPSNMVLGY